MKVNYRLSYPVPLPTRFSLLQYEMYEWQPLSPKDPDDLLLGLKDPIMLPNIKLQLFEHYLTLWNDNHAYSWSFYDGSKKPLKKHNVTAADSRGTVICSSLVKVKLLRCCEHRCDVDFLLIWPLHFYNKWLAS